jgi:hypothetical protein
MAVLSWLGKAVADECDLAGLERGHQAIATVAPDQRRRLALESVNDACPGMNKRWRAAMQAAACAPADDAGEALRKMLSSEDWQAVCPGSTLKPKKAPIVCPEAARDLFTGNDRPASYDAPEVAAVLFLYLRGAGVPVATARDHALWIAESSATRRERKRLRSSKLGKLAAVLQDDGCSAMVVVKSTEPMAGIGFKEPIIDLRRSNTPGPSLPPDVPVHVDGGLSEKQVREVLGTHLAALRFCYEKGLLHAPGLQGKVVLEWRVDAHGRVEGAKISASTLGNADTEGCLRRQAKSWLFPAPDGENRSVTLELVFDPGEKTKAGGAQSEH